MISIFRNCPEVARQKELLDMIKILVRSIPDIEKDIKRYARNDIKIAQIKQHLSWVRSKIDGYQREIEMIESRKVKTRKQ